MGQADHGRPLGIAAEEGCSRWCAVWEAEAARCTTSGHRGSELGFGASVLQCAEGGAVSCMIRGMGMC